MRGSRFFHHTEKVGGRTKARGFSTVTVKDHTLQLLSTHGLPPISQTPP